MSKRLDGIENILIAHEQRLGNIESTVHSHDGKFDRVFNLLNNIAERLTHHDSKAAASYGSWQRAEVRVLKFESQ